MTYKQLKLEILETLYRERNKSNHSMCERINVPELIHYIIFLVETNQFCCAGAVVVAGRKVGVFNTFFSCIIGEQISILERMQLCSNNLDDEID